jgi:serine/threonine protein kinase
LHKIRSYNRRQVKQGSNALINIPEFISAGDINVLYRNFETINWGYLVYGKFILNAYVEDHEECATKESLKKACTQVERLAQLGIYHGDIKRENIRFTEDGDVCLLDFSHCVIFNPKNKKKYEKYYSEMVEDFTYLFEEMGF